MKIFYEFDPEEVTGVRVAKDKRDEANARVANFVKESVLSTVAEGKSPVQGESWKRSLSPAYKKLKKRISGVDFSNMELEGDLLNGVDVTPRGRKVRLEVSSSQEDKADGHCNFSGKSKLPRRRFVPNGKEGQTFKQDIINGMREILVQYSEDNESKE